MLIVLLLGLLCWPISCAVRQSIDDREQAGCSANLAAIGAALHQYQAKYGCLPPAFVTDGTGRPAHSWRVLLLEFIDPTLFGQYDFSEPWDGPNNSRLSHRMPGCYACPAASAPPGSSSYAVIVAPWAAFRGSSSVSLSQIRAFGQKPILVAELDGAGVPWLEPRDLRLSATRMNRTGTEHYAELRQQGLAGPGIHLRGSNFLFSPTQVEPLKVSGDQLLDAMLSINGGEIWYLDDAL
jgi:hypothetical protein